jgi:hypothetical protein
VPEQQRRDDPRDQPRMRSASPRWLPSNALGRCTLRIQNAARRRRARAREDVDEEREPALLPSQERSRQRPVDDARSRHHDRREEDEEAPEDERVHQPGPRRWSSFCWPSTIAPRCARAPAVRDSRRGLPEADEPGQEAARAGEQRTATATRRRARPSRRRSP